MVVTGNSNSTSTNQPKLEETEAVLRDILTMYANDQDVNSAKTLAQLRREIVDVFEQKQKNCNASIKGIDLCLKISYIFLFISFVFVLFIVVFFFFFCFFELK
jgi:hypothetical protein